MRAETLRIAATLMALALSGCGFGPDPSPPGDSVPQDIPAIITELAGLSDSLAVCPDCPGGLLQAKLQGILLALEDLTVLAGDDIDFRLAPVTFHLQGDQLCGQYSGGMTGFWTKDSGGLAHVCLFDLEKTNRSLPFTPENAIRLEDQLLPVHEAMHVWFATRISNYGVEEPFCKLASFYVSGALAQTDPDPCTWFNASMPYPDRLMYDLCALGMDKAKLGLILDRTASDSLYNGGVRTVPQFTAIVTEVLGQDAAPAFRAAGLMP